MKNDILVKALQELRPNTDFAIYDNDINRVLWHDKNIIPPTEDEILAKYDELLQQAENEKYKEMRKKEYPTIVDQLDLLYHGGFDAWKAKIEEVKIKYPKPE